MKKNTERFDLATQIETISDETFAEICKKHGEEVSENRIQLINTAIWVLYQQYFADYGVKAVLLKADSKKLLLTFVRNPLGESVPPYKWNQVITDAVTKIKKELKIGTILIKKQMCAIDTDKFPSHVSEVQLAEESLGKEMMKKLDEDGLMADKYRMESMSVKTSEEIAAEREARDERAAEEAAIRMSLKKNTMETAAKNAAAIVSDPSMEEPSTPIVMNNKSEEEPEIQNIFEFKVDKNGQLCLCFN